MSKPNDDKLNLDDLTLDNVLGDGLTLEEKTEKPKDEDPIDDEEEEEEKPEPRKKDPILEDEEDEESEEEEEDEEGSEDEEESGSVATSIAKALGYELEKEYPDTEEGLMEFTKDIAQEIAEDQLKELFSQHPLVQKHLDYVLAGGDSDKFFEAYNPNNDYGAYEIEKNDSRTQKAFITDFFKSKGHDDEFIKDMLEDYEDSGKLYDKALVAQKQLTAIQQQEREQMVAKQKEAQMQQAKEQEAFWEQIANTIDSGNEFAGIRIPDKEKGKFFDYISEPINKQGATRRDIDYANATVEAKLAIDYLMYKGFNLKDIIDVKAKTKSVESLREKIKDNQERIRNKGTVDKHKKFDVDNLGSVENLFGGK